MGLVKSCLGLKGSTGVSPHRGSRFAFWKGRKKFKLRGTLNSAGIVEIFTKAVGGNGRFGALRSRFELVIASTYARRINISPVKWVKWTFGKWRYRGGTVVSFSGRLGSFSSHKKAQKFTKRGVSPELGRGKRVVNRGTWNSSPGISGAFIRSRSERPRLLDRDHGLEGSASWVRCQVSGAAACRGEF